MRYFIKNSWSVILFSALVNLLMLTGPLFMLQVYDRVLSSSSIPTLTALLLIVFVLYAFMAALDWIRARIMSRLARSWDEDMGLRLFKSVLAGDHKLPASDGVFSPLRDLDTVRQFVAGPGPLAFFDLPWIPIYLGIIYLLHAHLGIFAICAALLLVALMVGGQVVPKKSQIEAAQMREASLAIEQEARTQSDSVKAMALYEGLSQNWSALHANGLSLQQKTMDWGSFFSTLTKSARLFFQAGILALGALLAIQQEISTGTIIACAIILSRGLAPIEQLLAHWRFSIEALSAWKRLQPFTSAPVVPIPVTTLPTPTGQLSVENLSCYVPGSTQPLIADLNFTLEPGEVLALVGPSGVGKSTVLKAVLGVWPFTTGEVRLDGATIDQWDRAQISPHLGYVPQDIALFTGTIAQNISRFLPEAPSQQIIEAARAAHIHDMIVGFPDGYETVVGPRGIKLSAGQRQRIALARAFYASPHLIILDEPNSNLDTTGDQALSQAIEAMRKRGSTILIATHRPAVLRQVDKVLVLHEGRQVAYGPKDKIVDITPAGKRSNDKKELMI